MGLDFIKKAAPTFHKALDRRAVELRTPNLFSRDIPSVSRSASAEICSGSHFMPGDKVYLRILGKKLIAQRDNGVVAEFPSPPAEFLNHIEAGSGIAKGEVKVIHALSQTIEIEICE